MTQSLNDNEVTPALRGAYDLLTRLEMIVLGEKIPTGDAILAFTLAVMCLMEEAEITPPLMPFYTELERQSHLMSLALEMGYKERFH